jgi:aspartyl/asparaginyl beta-hydroxylase (cupin superfamily)
MTDAYKPSSDFPGLVRILAERQTLRQEALHAFATGSWTIMRDSRVDPDMWGVLPLLPEPEDRAVVPGWAKNRLVAPRTVEILEREPAVKAYSFSYLRPGGHIRPHRHDNPFVTAIITLHGGPDCYMKADGERRDFREDEIIVFDYRRVHEARNDGPVSWLALLLLFDIAGPAR